MSFEGPRGTSDQEGCREHLRHAHMGRPNIIHATCSWKGYTKGHKTRKVHTPHAEEVTRDRVYNNIALWAEQSRAGKRSLRRRWTVVSQLETVGRRALHGRPPTSERLQRLLGRVVAGAGAARRGCARRLGRRTAALCALAAPLRRPAAVRAPRLWTCLGRVTDVPWRVRPQYARHARGSSLQKSHGSSSRRSAYASSKRRGGGEGGC